MVEATMQFDGFIANYLGLVVETARRLFARMENAGVLHVSRKLIRILRQDLLAEMCGKQMGQGNAERR